MASEMNKSKRRLFPNVGITFWKRFDCLAGDKLLGKIRTWLSPPNPWKNYSNSRKLRQDQTGLWFINSDTLSEWKASGPSSLLWIHGKRESPASNFSFVD